MCVVLCVRQVVSAWVLDVSVSHVVCLVYKKSYVYRGWKNLDESPLHGDVCAGV